MAIVGGVKSLRKIQLGRETTAGTAVEATAIWRGLGTIEDTRSVVYDEEDVGLFAGTTRNHTEKYGAALSMTGAATFEQLPYILEAGLDAVNTGSVDTGGSGYIYKYVVNSAATEPATYTIEGGDNKGAEEMEYSYVESFTLTAEPSTAMQVSANWVGRQVSTSSFTGSLSLVEVEDILSSKGQLWIDTTTIGTTTASQTLMGATLNWNTGLLAKYTIDSGELTYSWVQPTRPSGTLELTYEHNDTAIAEKAAWRAGTPRLFRLLWQGSALSSAGDTYTYKTLQVDCAGRYEKFSAIADRDGNDIVTATARIGYEEDADLALEITVVNETEALP